MRSFGFFWWFLFFFFFWIACFFVWQWGWRCRAKLAVRGTSDNALIGLYQEGTHSVVDIPECKGNFNNFMIFISCWWWFWLGWFFILFLQLIILILMLPSSYWEKVLFLTLFYGSEELEIDFVYYTFKVLRCSMSCHLMRIRALGTYDMFRWLY